MNSHQCLQIRQAVQTYQQPLMRYARKLLRGSDRSQDVVQETFLRLCDEPQIAGDGRLALWLYRVCRSRAIDVIRKESRMPPVMEEKQTADPALAAEQDDDQARVKRLLDALPDNQQEVVRLKFQSGLSYRQIAEVTGLTATNVGYLLHTAIQTLRTQMTP